MRTYVFQMNIYKQILPKTHIAYAYYSRQVHLYQDFLGVVKHGNGSQAKTLKYVIFLVTVTMVKEPMKS